MCAVDGFPNLAYPSIEYLTGSTEINTVSEIQIQSIHPAKHAMADTSKPMATTHEESPQDRLTDLTARATALYAVKKYEEAAELYSEATEIQAEANGEMAEDNADLLFAYGRCLFYVAQKTSTVLGGTAASAQLKGGEKKASKKRKANGSLKAEAGPSTLSAEPAPPAQPVIQTDEPADVVPAEDADPEETKPSTTDKPFFRIEGDAADWADSDDEDEGGAEDDEDEEEEDDDFNTSFEILDLSRVLYLRKLESLKDKELSEQERSKQEIHLDTRLSDIYDLQAEISLEGEKFPEAVTDLRSCLQLRSKLYPFENSLLAECHYKLSLALEAASQVQQRDQEGNPVGEIRIDWDLRKQAATEQEQAIESCKLRVVQETKQLEQMPADKEKEKARAKENIEDVQDMIQAMEQRLEELKKPPVSVKAETEKEAAQELMGTVLGQMLGANGNETSKEERKAKLAEIVSNANDLTGMVKRKKPKAVEAEPEVNGKGKGKRPINEVEENDAAEPEKTEAKRVRIEDVVD